MENDRRCSPFSKLSISSISMQNLEKFQKKGVLYDFESFLLKDIKNIQGIILHHHRGTNDMLDRASNKKQNLRLLRRRRRRRWGIITFMFHMSCLFFPNLVQNNEIIVAYEVCELTLMGTAVVRSNSISIDSRNIHLLADKFFRNFQKACHHQTTLIKSP